jgi:hypothetical protein
MQKPKEKQKTIDQAYEEITNDRNIWKPKPGDTIEGTIVKRQKSNFGMSFILENDDGEHILPNHQLLETLLGKCMIGDDVRVICEEPIKTSNGQTLRVYKVFLKKPARF